jgi:hypothetical protein
MGSLRGIFVLIIMLLLSALVTCELQAADLDLNSKTSILYYKMDVPGETTLQLIPVIETSLYREYEGQSTIL